MKKIWHIDKWWKKTIYVIGWIMTVYFVGIFLVGFFIGFFGAMFA